MTAATSTSPFDPAPVDLVDVAHVTALDTDLGREIVVEIVAAFRSDAPDQVEALAVAIDNSDLVTVAQLAHSLAGSSSMVGLRRFSAHAKELELATAVPASAQPTSELLAESLAALDQLLAVSP